MSIQRLYYWLCWTIVYHSSYSLFYLHSCKHGFGIISHPSLPALQPIANNTFQCSPNCSLMLSELFYEPSLRLIPLKLRKAYIHSTVFDAYAAGRCTRCVNNNTSVKNHSMCSAFRLVSIIDKFNWQSLSLNIISLIFKYFCRHHRCRIFVLKKVVCASRRLPLRSSHHPRKACITSLTEWPLRCWTVSLLDRSLCSLRDRSLHSLSDRWVSQHLWCGLSGRKPGLSAVGGLSGAAGH